MCFEIPVLFIVFNRIDETKKTFDIIKRIKPSKLFIAADGPRKDRQGESDLCDKVRTLASNVSWECEVHTLFQNSNLGCGLGEASAMNWFFNNVEMGIIIEDDIVVDDSFFYFCEQMLHKYRDDGRVGMITAFNFMHSTIDYPYSYYFSKLYHIWGWASWRRAWKHYEYGVPMYDRLRQENLLKNIFDKNQSDLFKQIEAIRNKEHDTWDIQWAFACIINNFLCVTPCLNLMQNIGFNDNATHTKNSDISFQNTSSSLKFPLIHPDFVAQDIYHDNLIAERFVKRKSKIRGFLANYFKGKS